MNFEVGDRVRFVRAHHAMNPVLRGREGATGYVRIPPHPRDKKILVHFDRTDRGYGEWWIAQSRLEKLDE